MLPRTWSSGMNFFLLVYSQYTISCNKSILRVGSIVTHLQVCHHPNKPQDLERSCHSCMFWCHCAGWPCRVPKTLNQDEDCRLNCLWILYTLPSVSYLEAAVIHLNHKNSFLEHFIIVEKCFLGGPPTLVSGRQASHSFQNWLGWIPFEEAEH